MQARDSFIDGCIVVRAAVSDPTVVAAWTEPSVLSGHSVGSLAAHLVSACEVTHFLDLETPAEAASFKDAATYYAKAIELLTDDVNAGIHERNQQDANLGPELVVESLDAMLQATRDRLSDEPADRVVQVFAGSMLLDDFLETRIVEQVVHLDDLAQSIGVKPWANPPGADALVIACGAEIGRMRRGSPAMIRSLFRSQGSAATTLPVI